MELFKLLGTIAVKNEEANKNIDETTDKAEKSSGKLKAALSKVGGAAVKLGTAAVVAGATVTAAVTKMAVQGYADYEQLSGGIQKLFGDDVQKTVISNAQAAFKTAGMSANEYMDTVTSFSASLISGLGGDTAKAAEMADMAIRDMSDNANTFGTDMAAIQTAYQGFAKQNYTMLDNLKLGYGGTATEMARLINESGVLGDTIEVTAETVNDVSFDKIIEAINVTQKRMNITGTTTKEASKTISGSWNSLKASWKNLLVGMADDSQDFDALIGNVVDSASATAENLLPRVEKTLNGIGTLIEKAGPIISNKLPKIVSDIAPKLIKAGAEMVKSLFKGMRDNAGEIASGAADIISTLVSTLIELLPTIIETGVTLIVSLIDGITKDPDKLVNTAIKLITTLATSLIRAIPQLLTAAYHLIIALIQGIIANLPAIVGAAYEIIKNLLIGFAESYGAVVDAGKGVVDAIFSGISSAWDSLVSWFTGLWDSLFGGLSVGFTTSGNSRGGNSGGKGKSKGRPGRYATGLDYVPYDDFPAYLHKGEMVLTAGQAESVRGGNGLGNNEAVIGLLKELIAAVKAGRELPLVSPDGKELARFVAPFMGAQLQLVR